VPSLDSKGANLLPFIKSLSLLFLLGKLGGYYTLLCFSLLLMYLLIYKIYLYESEFLLVG